VERNLFVFICIAVGEPIKKSLIWNLFNRYNSAIFVVPVQS